MSAMQSGHLSRTDVHSAWQTVNTLMLMHRLRARLAEMLMSIGELPELHVGYEDLYS